MFCRLFIYLSCSVATVYASHKMDSWQSNSVLSCGVYLSELRWDYNGPPSFFSSICGYEPAFGSWSLCIYDMLGDREPEKRELIFEKTVTDIKSTCLELNPHFVQNLTTERYYASKNNASMHLGPERHHSALTYPIEVNVVTRERIGNAYHYYTSNFDKSLTYGCVTYLYLLLVILISCSFKFLKLSGLSRSILKHKLLNLARGHLILPTINGKHASHLQRNMLLTGLVPTTFEGLMIMGYCIISVLTLVIGYEIDPYSILFPTSTVQLARLLGDRAGIVAIIQVPLIIIFSTRNNIIEYLTGFRYTTLIVLHKWIGRVMILEAFIHSLAYTFYASILRSYRASSQEAYWQFGVVATTSCVALLVLSTGMLRKLNYETFLVVHIILVIIFFFTYFKHVEQFGYGWSIILPVSLWIFERVVRVLRIAKFGRLRANLQLIDDDLVKVQIKLPHASQDRKTFQPGQYIFLYFMQKSIFWQSHPFTVIEANGELTVVIKPKRGATNTILKELKKEGHTMDMNVLVEGPYGVTSPINRFGRILFLAGGSGIPGPLSHAIELGRKQTKRIIDLVITVKDLDILKAYEKELLSLEHLPVHTIIHLTRGGTSQYGSTDEAGILSKLGPFISIRSGRPDLEKLINNSLDDNSLAVVCCGPPQFVDQTRDLTAKIIVENPTSIVEYLEEYQCW